jgi:hypothetical protein
MTEWTYSYTQLKLWRECKRKYKYRYIDGIREPRTPAMCFGTLVHNGIEDWLSGTSPHWESAWANFLADCGETDTFKHPAYNLDTAKRCLDLYKRSPVQGRVVEIEQTQVYSFAGGYRYQSKADFVMERRDCDHDPHSGDKENWICCRQQPTRFTVDFKTTTSWQVDPLLPYDDQLLGQAVCNNADGFIRVTFQIDKKTGRVTGPHIEEQTVDPVLKEEWLHETCATILDIDIHKHAGQVWPKSSGSCMAYGRECPHMSACALGLTHT